VRTRIARWVAAKIAEPSSGVIASTSGAWRTGTVMRCPLVYGKRFMSVKASMLRSTTGDSSSPLAAAQRKHSFPFADVTPET
jgi:hypothetical protein